MGIKHLKKLETYLKKKKSGSNDFIPVYQISKDLNVNYFTMMEAIEYLRNKYLIQTKGGRIRWKN